MPDTLKVTVTTTTTKTFKIEPHELAEHGDMRSDLSREDLDSCAVYIAENADALDDNAQIQVNYADDPEPFIAAAQRYVDENE